MSKYQITGIIYIHTGMNEWQSETLYMRISTQTYSAFTAPDEHIHINQLHIMSIQPAKNNNSRTTDQFIIMTSIGKENRSSQCLSYKEQLGGGGGGGGERDFILHGL